ncbi:C2H2-type zinc finger family protein [Striga hermonthica]|uniref:C2H2-type zinc finger family protein n=1 Tax=Striga hermonthica TaxID=68872 RepID=A0A9N7RG87_STRHE|nr:C2H2-type zinc finger family protein [Striga hermonthica]
MLAQEEIIPIKRKRSKRLRHPSPLALTMSASSSGAATDLNSGDESTLGRDEDRDEEDMANCLILLARGPTHEPPTVAASATAVSFQCKTCDKNFTSFQALGGHRASHKKLSVAPRENKSNGSEITILSLRVPTSPDEKKAARVHECSLCGTRFASGQALGGHMRRHRPLATRDNEAKRPRTVLSVDLNLPAMPEDAGGECETVNEFALALPHEQVIVFSATSLVDYCHY